MKKLYKNTELSDRRCEGRNCNKLLKKNLLVKRPNARLCYECWYLTEMRRRGVNVTDTRMA